MVDLQHKKLVFFDSLMGEDRKLLKHLEHWIKEEAQVRGLVWERGGHMLRWGWWDCGVKGRHGVMHSFGRHGYF
jgi:hypothetical protein